MIIICTANNPTSYALKKPAENLLFSAHCIQCAVSADCTVLAHEDRVMLRKCSGHKGS